MLLCFTGGRLINPFARLKGTKSLFLNKNHCKAVLGLALAAHQARGRLGRPPCSLRTLVDSQEQLCLERIRIAAMGKKQQQNNKRRRVAADVPAHSSTVTKVESEKYSEQLDAKVSKVEQLFDGMSLPELEVFESRRDHYRLRAEFKVWQSKEDLYYVMFEKVTEDKKRDAKHEWDKHRMDSFPVASELVNELMAALIDNIKDQHVLRHKLFQANFHTTLSGEAMVTLIYHRNLDETWKQAAKQLRATLGRVPHAKKQTIDLIGRSKKQKILLDKDHVLETMHVDNRDFTYQQIEGSFSQPNGLMCQNMLEWARDVTKGSAGDLLELYCGNGNFTVALADNFREVIATEVSKASVAAAKYNLAANGISNVSIARLSSEEFTKAWRGEREFFRLKELPSVSGRKFQTILVDPPRAGLDDKTVELLQHFDSIVYISCNPHTLHANLENIRGSHIIKRFAIFDQFPYTEHVECGVYLVWKQQALLPRAVCRE